MTSNLASPLSMESHEDAYRTAIDRNRDHLDRFGARGIFYIASETAESAWYLSGCIYEFDDKAEVGEVVCDKLVTSFRSNVLCFLAILCAGVPCLRLNNPKNMRLYQEALASWPGQPLQSFGQPMPVLEAAYHYANDARATCMRAITGRTKWHVETHQDIPRQLTDGFELLVKKISIVRDWLTQISYEQYAQSDTALWRLHDLYRRRCPDVRVTGQRHDMPAFDDVDVERVAKALEQHGTEAKADVICQASRPMRRATCLDIRRFLISARTGNHGT